MSSALPLIKFEPATAKDLEDFFFARGVDNSCSRCGSQKYLVIFDFENNIPAIAFSTVVGEINPTIRMPQFVTNCENCGHSRLFSRVVLNNWLLERKQSDDVADE